MNSRQGKKSLPELLFKASFLWKPIGTDEKHDWISLNHWAQIHMAPGAGWYHRNRPKRVCHWECDTHFNQSEHLPQQCFSIDISYQDALLLRNSAFITFSTIPIL